MECWSIGVLRQVRIAPALRVGDAEGAEERDCYSTTRLTRSGINFLPPLQGGLVMYMYPGVKTPG